MCGWISRSPRRLAIPTTAKGPHAAAEAATLFTTTSAFSTVTTSPSFLSGATGAGMRKSHFGRKGHGLCIFGGNYM
jgi:hypothetical protein